MNVIKINIYQESFNRSVHQFCIYHFRMVASYEIINGLPFFALNFDNLILMSYF